MDGTQAANQLVLNLGQAADTASITGTANAKINELIQYLVVNEPPVVLGRTANTGTFSTSQSSYQNMISLSGKGSLLGLISYGVAAVTASGVKITLDGTVIMNYTAAMNYTYPYYLGVGSGGLTMYVGSSSGPEALGSITGALDFKENLTIQVESDGTHALTFGYAYNQ